MRVNINKNPTLRASLVALSLASAALPAMASAQLVWPTVPTTRVRSFNNLSGVKINDPCAGLEQTPEECPALQDDSDALPLLSSGTPYPSTIEIPAAAFVAGSKVTDVNVTLKNLNHAYLNDVDIVLVGPQGQYVMLLSNVSATGGSHVVAQNLNFKFDDSARLPLPHSNDNSGRASSRATVTVGGVTSPNPLYNIIYSEWAGVWTDHAIRTFKPSDYDTSSDTDDFLPPAPQNLTTLPVVVTPNATTGVPTVTGGGQLSVFNGQSPVGVWSLYVADDYFLYDGQLGGWEIEITAQQP